MVVMVEYYILYTFFYQADMGFVSIYNAFVMLNSKSRLVCENNKKTLNLLFTKYPKTTFVTNYYN